LTVSDGEEGAGMMRRRGRDQRRWKTEGKKQRRVRRKSRRVVVEDTWGAVRRWRRVGGCLGSCGCCCGGGVGCMVVSDVVIWCLAPRHCCRETKVG
jgi:hypothetical protein